MPADRPPAIAIARHTVRSAASVVALEGAPPRHRRVVEASRFGASHLPGISPGKRIAKCLLEAPSTPAAGFRQVATIMKLSIKVEPQAQLRNNSIIG